MNPKTKNVCSPCLRGTHDHCTLPDSCGCEKCYPEAPPLVTWEEPPPRRGRGARILSEAQLAELKANPKRWAKVKEYPLHKQSATSMASNIRHGKTHMGSGWEATGRITGEKSSTLYVRWTGDEKK